LAASPGRAKPFLRHGGFGGKRAAVFAAAD
jgi:hypothetical protein